MSPQRAVFDRRRGEPCTENKPSTSLGSVAMAVRARLRILLDKLANSLAAEKSNLKP
jgi:hypothetical protein